MSVEIFVLFFFIIIGTPFCGAQECIFSSKEAFYICKNIVHEFPRINYGSVPLQCYNCQIEIFNRQTFPHANSLQSFNISNSGLQHVAPYGFSNLRYLKFLFLQNNGIVNISENAFNGVKMLCELHLEDNLLKALNPGFLNETSCKFVNISNNLLEGLPKDVFQGSTSLLNLDLSFNKISKLDPGAFLGLEELKELDLSANFLCHIPVETFRMLNNLLRLDLESNKLGSIVPGLFSGLRNLNFLNLARNSLRYFDSIVLFSMMHLRKLDISGNGMIFYNANNILVNVPTLQEISFEDNLVTCSSLRDYLQFFRSKGVDVQITVFRYEYQNIDGIACFDFRGYDRKANRLETFLEECKKAPENICG